MKKLKLTKVIASSLVLASMLTIPSYATTQKVYDQNNSIISGYSFDFSKSKQNISYLIKSDGSHAINIWVKAYQIESGAYVWYYFGCDGKAAVNWQEINGKWYYFSPSNQDSDTCGAMFAEGFAPGYEYYLGNDGAMVTNRWVKASFDNKWYYLGYDGKVLKNTITPDGYRVDNQGKCI